MEVKSCKQMIDTWGLVDTGELHACSLASETNLVENGNAIVDSYRTTQLIEVVAKGNATVDMGVELDIDILGDDEGIGFLGHIVFLTLFL